MNRKLFSEAMSEVNDKYYEEAENYRCQKQRYIKLAYLAACAAVVVAVALGTLWKQNPGQPAPQPGHDAPTITSPDDRPDDPEQAIGLNINEIEAPNAVSSNIGLDADDFTAMSYKEVLTYFGASLPITETLPYLTLQSEELGIYQTEDRGIYYDGNVIAFQNSDGTERINIDLSKVFKHTSDVFTLRAEDLKFTDINGRELAVFHYTDENGADCYHTEFLQNDVAFRVSSENISAEDYAKCLQVLVDKTQQNSSPVHTVEGEIIAADPYANSIGVYLDDGQAPKYGRGYGVNLPDGYSAGEYSLGDRVKVTFSGEPATILTIWGEQLEGIELLS